MNHQQIVDAGIAAIGGGTVVENADKWDSLRIGDDVQEFLDALEKVTLDSQRLLIATVQSLPGTRILTCKDGLELAKQVLLNASIAYRLLRKAIGDPMFPASETDNPEWPGEPNEM